MTSTRLILGMCILLSAVVAPAEELSRIACDPADALDYQPGIAVGRSRTKPAKGSGVVHEKAVVLTLSGSSVEIKIAVDSAKPDAKRRDTLRLDFTGKGKFTNAPTVSLKGTSPDFGYFHATFGPQTIRATLPTGEVPLTVKGEYLEMDTYCQLMLSMGTALQGKGRFGGRVLPIRIIDGNANLTLGDSWVASGRSVKRGDTLAVDTGDGSFTKDVHKACYGSPIRIDGTWYTVALAKDGKKIAVEPLNAGLGKIQIKHPKWRCLLVGKKHLLWLTGGPKPIAVPADEYVVMKYQQWGLAGEAGIRPFLSCSDDTSRGAKRASVDVMVGKTAVSNVGSPLTASIAATRQPGTAVSLSLVLADVSGKQVSDIRLANGKRPVPPKVTVRDADGKTVYTTSLEYG